MVQRIKFLSLAALVTCSLALATHVRALDAGAVAASASGAPGPRAWIEGPLLSLPDARARALGSSPELEAARSAAAAAGGGLRQARAWANPEIEVDAEEVGGDRPGWDEAEVTWTVAQRLEIFGTRGARASSARHAHDAAIWSAAAVQLDLLAEVDRRFADVLVAQSRIEALNTNDSLAIETVRAVSALVEAGEVSPIEVDRAEAERVLATTRLLAARFDHARALRSLAQLWGSREADFTGVRGSLEVAPRLPDRDSLAAAVAELPDLQLAEADVHRAEADVRLAGRGRLPEIAIRGGLRQIRASDERSFVAGIGLSLPVFDRKGGTLDETRARLQQARAGRAAAQSRIVLARATAYDALALALETSRSLREESLPRAQAVHESVHEGYRRGKFGLLDLIDARRSLLQARLEYIDALGSVWTARADLTRLVGQGSSQREGESR
jgi:cobalt-zinc-cadmium efflux system outer membrane protein